MQTYPYVLTYTLLSPFFRFERAVTPDPQDGQPDPDLGTPDLQPAIVRDLQTPIRNAFTVEPGYVLYRSLSFIYVYVF